MGQRMALFLNIIWLEQPAPEEGAEWQAAILANEASLYIWKSQEDIAIHKQIYIIYMVYIW